MSLPVILFSPNIVPPLTAFQGLPFVNERYKKGVPFRSKMVYKRPVRGWSLGRRLPV